MKTRPKMEGLLGERLIPISKVPSLLPKSDGTKVHYQTAHRWTRKGAGGRVLESVLVGGKLYTSIEAVQRFAVSRNEAREADGYNELVEAQLKAAGL